MRWPAGVQNVLVSAVWGYTDPDPNNVAPCGETAELVRHCCKLMVAREFPQLGDYDNREDRQHRHRIASEGGRDQRRTMQPLELGAFTSDVEIDRILEFLHRPLDFGIG